MDFRKTPELMAPAFSIFKRKSSIADRPPEVTVFGSI